MNYQNQLAEHLPIQHEITHIGFDGVEKSFKTVKEASKYINLTEAAIYSRMSRDRAKDKAETNIYSAYGKTRIRKKTRTS